MFCYKVASLDNEIVVNEIETYGEAEKVAEELSNKHKRTFWIIDTDVDCDVKMIEYKPTEEEAEEMKRLINEERRINEEIKKLRKELEKVKEAKSSLYEYDSLTNLF